LNFDGFQPSPIERFSSLVESESPDNLPLGVSPYCRNVRFHLTGCRTRDGIQNLYGFVLPDGGAVTGLAAQKIGQSQASDIQVPIAFSALGDLYVETPAGSGQVQKLAGPQVTLPANASMQAALAFKRHYVCFTDLINSVAPPAVYNNLLGKLDPLGMKTVGQLWTANTQVYVGEVMCPAVPVGGNGHTYRCIQSGITGAAAPAFPLGEGAIVNDGTAQWQENTPLMVQALPEPAAPAAVRALGGGAFAAARDVYILITLVNGQGETDAQTALAFKFVNTTLNDGFNVPSPTLATWIQGLQAPYAVTGYNVYEADVATGAAAPALASYKKVNVGALAIGVAALVATTGAGAAPSANNTALLVPAGNICAGLRYMFVIFVNRNGNFAGTTMAAVVSYNASTNGFQLYVPHIPIGPENTIARICCFTPAGQLGQLAGSGISNAGPYFFIEPAVQLLIAGKFDYSQVPGGVTISDVINGVQMTSTVICDNVTTSATFNFTDDYLKSTLNDVSDSFRKIQVPVCSDIYFAPTLRRMFFAADALKSGWYISPQDDPETIYGDTGFVQAAENNGQNRTAVREYSGTVYLMKEKSGYILAPSADDPNKWDATEQWKGSGPCGPRAVDVCTDFMCYVHRSGVYIFTGSKPFRISKELPAHTGRTWKNINWNYQQTIWVMIDDETQEIRIGVPYGKSTVPNLILKCNYEESPDFAPAIHFSPYVGKEIAAGSCRKWSIDDIAANLAIRAERTLLNPPDLMDNATVQSQILLASSNPDGAVAAITPGVYNDNGGGIDSVYETSCPEGLFRPTRLGGVQGNIGGRGELTVSVLALRGKNPAEGQQPIAPANANAAIGGTEVKLKPCQAGVPYSAGGRLTNERLRMRLSNNRQPDVWFDLKWAAIYSNPVSSARPR
jgi:hypothetical protein